MKRADEIELARATYDLSGSGADWLLRISRVCLSALDRGFGVVSYSFDFKDPSSQRLYDLVGPETPRGVPDLARRIFYAGSPERIEPLYLSPTTVLTRQNAHRDANVSSGAFDSARSWGIRDLLAFGFNTERCGCAITFPSPRVEVVSARLAVALERVAWRMRGAWCAREEVLRQANDYDETGDAALVDSRGQTHAASGAAESADARSLLRKLAVSIDRSRARIPKADDPTGWRAFVDSGWALVDAFEADGRRYFVAKRVGDNEPDARTLTPLQRQIANLLARGHAANYIAIELELSPSTISHHIASLQRCFGVRSRVDLVTVLSELGFDRRE